MRSPRLACFGVALTAAAAFLTPLSAGAQAPPNIAIIILDDTGIEMLGAFNQANQEVDVPTGQLPPPEHRVTPTIDAIAAEGVIFRNAWSTPMCASTRATMLGGLYGFRTGALSGWPTTPLSTTLATKLRDRQRNPKYNRRQAIGKWHLSASHVEDALYPTPAFQALGFEAYAGEPIEGMTTGGGSVTYTTYGWYVDSDLVSSGTDQPYLTTREVEEAVAFVNANPQEPWLLWLALHATHTPYDDSTTVLPSSPCWEIPDAPGKGLERRIRCAQLEILDQELAELRAVIDLSDTVVILLGDNGSWPIAAAGVPGKVNRGGKNSLYEGGINVPLIVAGAGVDTTVHEKSALVHTVDIYPTVVQLADIVAVDPNDGTDGVSFEPVLTGASEGERACVYVDGSQHLESSPKDHDVAIRNATHKLIRTAETDSNGNRYFKHEFYDLASDPDECIPDPSNPTNCLSLSPTGPEFDALNDVLTDLDAKLAVGEAVSPCKSKGTPPDQGTSTCGLLGIELIPALLILSTLRRRIGGTKGRIEVR